MATANDYLLDTNVLVHLVRGNALGNRIDATYGLRMSLNTCLICVVTRGELLSLAIQLKWGAAKRSALKSLLDEVVEVDISHDVIVDRYAEIDAYSRTVGRKMGKNDAWIAAVASVTGATLLSTDKDFDHLSSQISFSRIV